MMKLTISISVCLVGGLALAQPADMFASEVVSFSNLGNGIYGHPQAALGKPATWIRDGQNQVRVSWGYPAWNVDPNGSPVVVTVRTGGHLTLRFRRPVVNDRRNWYGFDFIVFGNAAIGVDQTLGPTTNLNQVLITGGPDWIEPMSVSVSPDGIQWHTYPATPTTGADGFWPTQSFRANGTEAHWGRPVAPWLQRSDFTGRTVAEAIEMLEGSAGGTAFDLTPTGFDFIQFIRFEGNGGEIDAVSRVTPRLFASSPTRVP